MNLTKNTILITGGATGIGLAFAEQLIKSGSTVIICGRREHRLKEVKEKLPEVHTTVCDVSKSDEREKLAEWVIQNFPKMNVLINNAGMQKKFILSRPIEINDARLETATNFIAPIHLGSLFIEHLKKQKTAAIINISSGLAFTPMAFAPVYCATKAALHSFTLSLRYQLKETSVKVYEIIPPMVDTELGTRDKSNPTRVDWGMNVDEFVTLSLEALKNDVFEAAIGSAEGLREKREGLFNMLNH